MAWARVMNLLSGLNRTVNRNEYQDIDNDGLDDDEFMPKSQRDVSPCAKRLETISSGFLTFFCCRCLRTKSNNSNPIFKSMENDNEIEAEPPSPLD